MTPAASAEVGSSSRLPSTSRRSTPSTRSFGWPSHCFFVHRSMLMRAAVIIFIVLLSVSPALAQRPYDLDPYNPTDAAMLRNYGSVLVGLTPLLELRKLDPYVPSQAALLRQLGGALPVWVGWYPPVPVPASAPLTPFARTDRSPATSASNLVVIIVPPRTSQSPSGGFRDRAVPVPGSPRPRVAPRVQVANTPANSSIEVRCNAAECHWRVLNEEPGSDTPRRAECGWMPRGAAIETGGPLPCEQETAAP